MESAEQYWYLATGHSLGSPCGPDRRGFLQLQSPRPNRTGKHFSLGWVCGFVRLQAFLTGVSCGNQFGTKKATYSKISLKDVAKASSVVVQPNAVSWVIWCSIGRRWTDRRGLGSGVGGGYDALHSRSGCPWPRIGSLALP